MTSSIMPLLATPSTTLSSQITMASAQSHISTTSAPTLPSHLTILSIKGFVLPSDNYSDISRNFSLNEVTAAAEECEPPDMASIGVLVLTMGAVFLLIILLALFGNLLVIVSVLRTKNLRRQKAYYFVVSLAVADLLVSVFAMSFNGLTVILQGKWLFGLWLCDLFNSMDVVFCTASILNLFCISMYRWCQIVAFPESYREYFTRPVVLSLILGIWVLSTLIAFVPIWSSVYTTQEFLANRSPCVCDFRPNAWYAMFSSSISFWLPSIGIVYFYIEITRCAVQKAQADMIVRRSTCSAGSAFTQYSNGSTANQALLDPYAAPGSRASGSISSSQSGTVRVSRNYSISPALDRNESLRDNINAAKTLVIILIVFFVCWFPFFLTYVLAYVAKVNFPESWIVFIFWLGYTNSAINPFIYAVKFQEFRPAFRDTLRCLACQSRQRGALPTWTSTSTNINFKDKNRVGGTTWQPDDL